MNTDETLRGRIVFSNISEFYKDLKIYKEKHSLDENTFVGFYLTPSKKKQKVISPSNIDHAIESGYIDKSYFRGASFTIYASAKNDFHKDSSYAQVLFKGKCTTSGAIDLSEQDLADDVKLTLNTDKLYSIVSSYMKLKE